jgi:hypothetical protein
VGIRTSQAAFAAALLDPTLPVPAGVSSARGTADAKRFAVYRNNVAVSLIKALAGRFPVVAKLVGADFFAGMARSYIARTRPSSPLLFAYGDDFADFVAGFAPAASVPYLADVARLEAACTRAYHAANAEPLGLSALAGLDTHELADARLAPHPAAALIGSRFPVGSIWQAHQSGAEARLEARGGETVLVVRPEYEVRVHVLPDRDAIFAAALLAGEVIGEATRLAAIAERDFDFGTALAGLVSLGAFLTPPHEWKGK